MGRGDRNQERQQQSPFEQVFTLDWLRKQLLPAQYAREKPQPAAPAASPDSAPNRADQEHTR